MDEPLVVENTDEPRISVGELPKAIGSHLRQARKHRNLTKGQLSRLAKVSVHGVEIAEAGSLSVPMPLMQALAVALRCNIMIRFVAKETDGTITKCCFKLGFGGCGLEKESATGGLDEKLQDMRSVDSPLTSDGGGVPVPLDGATRLGAKLSTTSDGRRAGIHLRSVGPDEGASDGTEDLEKS